MIHVVATLLLAAPLFDANMSPQDKKNTGIYKLSDQEKGALKEWVDNSYSRPTAKKTNPSLSEILYNGSYLRFTDNSIWNVRPQDTPISQGWISEVEILIDPSDDPNYPFKLTNNISKSSIYAKRVQSLPTSPSRAPMAPQPPTTTPTTPPQKPTK